MFLSFTWLYSQVYFLIFYQLIDSDYKEMKNASKKTYSCTVEIFRSQAIQNEF